jgi:hypothetical protein
MSLNWGYGEDGDTVERWAFVADFREYAGNFTAPFAAYVIGRSNEGMDGPVWHLQELFQREVPNGEEMMNDLVSSRHGEYGWSHYELVPTPGRRNNGMGEHSDRVMGVKASPAYESIALFLDRKPTDEELALLVKRAKDFHKQPVSHLADKRSEVLRCRLVKEVTRLVEVTSIG